jgi:hypothetical protein
MMMMSVLRGNFCMRKITKQLLNSSCQTAVATRTQETKFISACTGTQQAGGQRGGARHSGAPMLRRYAMTSALL